MMTVPSSPCAKAAIHPYRDFAIPYKPRKPFFRKDRLQILPHPRQCRQRHRRLFRPGAGHSQRNRRGYQYVSVDLGEAWSERLVPADLSRTGVGPAAADHRPGIVIHSEKTNSTMKILDAGSDIRVRDRVLVLPKALAGALRAKPGRKTAIIETLPGEGEQPVQAEGEAAAGQGGALNFSILFPFDGKQPIEDHAADYAAIRDFIANKSEYLVTLRATPAASAATSTTCGSPRSGWRRSRPPWSASTGRCPPTSRASSTGKRSPSSTTAARPSAGRTAGQDRGEWQMKFGLVFLLACFLGSALARCAVAST